MAHVVIKPIRHGPYIVKGTVKLVDHLGNEYEVTEAFALCRCGASSKKPFCDGTHARIGFSTEETAPEPARSAA